LISVGHFFQTSVDAEDLSVDRNRYDFILLYSTLFFSHNVDFLIITLMTVKFPASCSFPIRQKMYVRSALMRYWYRWNRRSPVTLHFKTNKALVPSRLQRGAMPQVRRLARCQLKLFQHQGQGWPLTRDPGLTDPPRVDEETNAPSCSGSQSLLWRGGASFLLGGRRCRALGGSHLRRSCQQITTIETRQNKVLCVLHGAFRELGCLFVFSFFFKLNVGLN